MANEPKVTVCDGNAEQGWVIDVHDGEHAGTYMPDAPTRLEAEAAALKAFCEDFPPAPEPIPQPLPESPVASDGSAG